MKKILIVLLVLALAGGAVGYYLYNKPVASLENKKADMSVTAEQLLTDYEADETAANDKYLGKIIDVSGTVSNITTEEGKQKITLDTGNPISAIICEMEATDADAAVKTGDPVHIKGLCSGYLSDVILVQGVLVR